MTAAFAFQLAQQPAEKYIAAMDRPDRVLKIDEVLAKLALKPGDIVADVGWRFNSEDSENCEKLQANQAAAC